MERFGVKATADALENLIRDGRPEFKGDDGQVRVWTPHRRRARKNPKAACAS
jgi:excinuclease ABC subunit B